MPYIGASAAEIRAALRSRGTVVRNRPDGEKTHQMYRLKGTGAVPLTKKLVRTLVNIWWSSPAGTQIVVGWIPSEFIDSPRAPNPNDVKLIGVRRPADGDLFARMPEYYRGDNYTTRTHAFMDILADLMRIDNHRTLNINTHGTHGSQAVYSKPVFLLNNGSTRFHTYLFAWPAGIADDRTSVLIDAAHATKNRVVLERKRKWENRSWPSTNNFARTGVWRPVQQKAAIIQEKWREILKRRKQRLHGGMALKRKGKLDRDTISHILKKV